MKSGHGFQPVSPPGCLPPAGQQKREVTLSFLSGRRNLLYPMSMGRMIIDTSKYLRKKSIRVMSVLSVISNELRRRILELQIRVRLAPWGNEV